MRWIQTDMDMGMMGFGVLMMFIGLLVVLALVAIVVWAVIHLTGSGGSHPARDGQARQILNERYARGEIGDEEYKRIRRELA